MEKISNLIKKVDFVGLQLKPTLNGSNRIKSLLGGLISLVAIACILFGFGYFGLSMIKKDKPIMNIVQEMRPQAIAMTKDNPFFIIVYDGYGNLIHNEPGFKRAIDIQIELWKIRYDEGFSIDIYNGKTKACDKSDLSEKVYSDLTGRGHDVEMMVCHDSSSPVTSQGKAYDEEVYVKNRYATMDSNVMHYKFTHCGEKADPGCGAFFEKYPRMIINVYKLNYYIDQTDYENPVKVDLNPLGYSMTKTVKQSVYISTRINEIVTDKSMFLSDETKETYYSMIAPTVSIGAYNEGDRMLIEFVLSIDNIVNINQRRYMKIPELLANMGGFMKAAIVLGNLVSYLYSEYTFYVAVNKVQAKSKRQLMDLKLKPNEPISVDKSSISPIKPASNLNNLKLPSFLEYIASFLSKSKRKEINKKNTFKYLELDFLIANLSFLEEIKQQRENNFVNGDN